MCPRYENREKHYTYQGQTKTISQWSEELGVRRSTLHSRLRTMTLERAMSLPPTIPKPPVMKQTQHKFFSIDFNFLPTRNSLLHAVREALLCVPNMGGGDMNNSRRAVIAAVRDHREALDAVPVPEGMVDYCRRCDRPFKFLADRIIDALGTQGRDEARSSEISQRQAEQTGSQQQDALGANHV